MIRRFGERPVENQRYTIRHGAYAILPRDGRILLTRQMEPTPEIQLPGGGIDAGESPIAALHREVFEETGWSIATPRKLGVFRRFAYMPEYDKWAEKICHIYQARPLFRRGPPTEKGHSALWMDPEETIHNLGNPGDASFLAEFLQKM